MGREGARGRELERVCERRELGGVKERKGSVWPVVQSIAAQSGSGAVHIVYEACGQN